jgi:hypothetical protein
LRGELRYRPFRWLAPGTLAVLGVLVLSLASGTVQAQSGDFAEVALDRGSPLSPGQAVRITWTALPPEAEEFELLLQCESPVPITLRLTESQDPDLAYFLWRVPGISCDRARLLLRQGMEGREILWAQSVPFRIEGSPSATTPKVAFLSGEYWVEDGPAPLEWTNRTSHLVQSPGHPCDPCEAGVSHSGLSPVGDSGPIFFSPPEGKPRPRPANFSDRDRLLAVQLRI